MNVSKYELSMLAIIRDEVDLWLKSNTGRRNPTQSNICKTLTQILPKITAGKSFTVSINETSRDPFIMAIYPDITELNNKAKELVDILDNPKSDNQEYIKSWGGISKWVLEIDTRILLKGCELCVRTGSEFVALLCHEIGHVMIEDPFRLIYNYKRVVARMNRFNKLASSKSTVVRKFMLPMFVNTLSFRIPHRTSDLQKEMLADGYVPEEYRGSLLSYIEECIRNNPDSYHLIKTSEAYDNDQELSINFSRDAISTLKSRRDVLRQELSAQFSGCTGSDYHKNLVMFLSKHVMGYDPEKDVTHHKNESMMLDTFQREMDACEEAAIVALESTKVTDRDLTILEVECSNVSTTEDKLYLIHTIYDYIEALKKENAARLKKAKDDKIKELIKKDERLARLYKCRDAVVNKNTSNVGERYGVFVKYPEGYEG